MWQRGNILDGLYAEPSPLEGTDGRLPTRAGSLDENFDLGDPVLSGFSGTFFSGLLSSKWCTFARPFETDRAGGTPANDITVDIGDGYNGIVEGSIYVSYTSGNGTTNSPSAGLGSSFSHTNVPFCQQTPQPPQTGWGK